MSSSTVSKKRKRGVDDAEKVTLQLSSQPASQVGPVLGQNRTSQFCLRRGIILTLASSKLSLPPATQIHCF